MRTKCPILTVTYAYGLDLMIFMLACHLTVWKMCLHLYPQVIGPKMAGKHSSGCPIIIT